MDICKAFDIAFKRAVENDWDFIYVVVDIHDTIVKSCWENEETYQYFPWAKECLRLMSKCKNIKMILWSSSYNENIEHYVNDFKKYGIVFDYVNENPEVNNTTFACFDKKLYFNVGIDNAFGFDAEFDWKIIFNYFINKFNKLSQ